MNTFILFSAVCAFGISEAMKYECPLEACPAIEYPPECKAQSYLIFNGRACKQCDKCIRAPMEGDDGCPLVPCVMLDIPERCKGRSYYIWKGRLCEDCDVNICNGD